MFCVQCGTNLPEDALVCPNCGAKAEKEINFSDVTDYAGKQAQQSSESIRSQTQNFRQTQTEETAGKKIKNVNELFVDPEEQHKAVIGGGYLSNMLHSGVLGKGFGVLTDRRLYYRGKCFYKIGGHYMKTDEDCTVDLRDITSTGFIYRRNLIWLVAAVLSGFASLYVWAYNSFSATIVEYSEFSARSVRSYEFNPVLMFLLCICIMFTVLFIVTKKTIYEVTFAGGLLSIKASSYGVLEVRAFDKALHKEKDRLLTKNNK